MHFSCALNIAFKIRKTTSFTNSLKKETAYSVEFVELTELAMQIVLDSGKIIAKNNKEIDWFIEAELGTKSATPNAVNCPIFSK